MAFFGIPAAIGAGGKILSALKGAKILGTAAKAAKGLGTAAKPALGATKRFAGDTMTKYLGGKVGPKSLAENFGLDAAFGVMAGINTPGDLGDKLIAGTSVGASGALGGVLGTTGYARLFNKGQMPTGIARQFTEFGGAMMGDEVGYAASEALQRMKGGGMSAYERMQVEGDRQYRNQIEEELLAKYGLLPGVPTQNTYLNDPFLSENGLV